MSDAGDSAELAGLVTEIVRDLRAGTAADTVTDTATQLWDVLEDTGLARIGVPEDLGGPGGTVEDVLVVVRTLAEHGVLHPLVESATADWVLVGAGRGPVGRCTLVCPDPAEVAGGGPLEVPWGRWATHLLVVGAGDGEGAGALLHDLGAPGTVVEHGVDVAGAPSDRVSPAAPPQPVAVTPPVDRVRARAALLRCAVLVGATTGAYALTRSFVRERHQFGEPLVAIPAVATALATVRAGVIQAETALTRARALHDGPGGPDAVAVARVVCGAAATETARVTHQLHGAMGITEEYPLHRFTRILWAARDADLAEHRWAELLGTGAMRGEQTLWDDLTAPAPR